MELAEKGVYATGTIRSNHIGIPSRLKDKKVTSKLPQGTLLWEMHNSRKICAVTWMDKKPVTLVSTHARPIAKEGEKITVPRRVKGERIEIPTSPVHYEYTTYMRGVDVADQLRGEYTCQIRSHKWWHRIFFFLLDTTVVNAYILHCHACIGLCKPPSTHLDFLLSMALKLADSNLPARQKASLRASNPNAVHSLEATNGRKLCITCKVKRTRMACPQCSYSPMCLGECYKRAHTKSMK